MPTDFLTTNEQSIYGRANGAELGYTEYEENYSVVAGAPGVALTIPGLSLTVESRGRPFWVEMGGWLVTNTALATGNILIHDTTRDVSVAHTGLNLAAGALYGFPVIKRRLDYPAGTHIFEARTMVTAGTFSILTENTDVAISNPFWLAAYEV